jgi:dihydroorotase
MMMLTERRPILLANAHILDPSRDLEIDGDLLIADGIIREAKRGIGAAGVPEATALPPSCRSPTPLPRSTIPRSSTS